MVGKLSGVTALFALATTSFAGNFFQNADGGFKSAIERKLERTTIAPSSLQKPSAGDIDPSLLYPAYNISVPIDHFHNDTLYEPHSNGTFPLRYWFDATYYKPGGPVIVLQSGETDATGRLTFLQNGLLHKLAVSTHGIGVVLEHRFYGTSMPTPDFSTKSLRFLTTDQALADQAYFAQNVVYKGFEHLNLTAPHVAYLAYGGSYAGAFVAFLRKLYPDVFWGAISSSGVVEAIWDYWTYFEPIRVYAQPDCVSITQKVTNVMDNIFLSNKSADIAELKSAFGLPNVTYNDDFAYTVAAGIDSWQGKNWDPALNDPTFDEYCATITNSTLVFPSTASLNGTAKDLITKGGWGNQSSTLTTPLLNWIGWLGANYVSGCTSADQDSCFGTHDPATYEDDSIAANWRAWPYQWCTQWGFLQTGSGVPATQLPLVSRTNTLAYGSIICNEAFDIYTPPDVDAINKYGGFNISYPRLAIVDGEWDPWRPSTPHASPFNSSAVNRTSTVEEPFILIEGAVHHWDENGLFKNQTTAELPPKPVKDVQKEEIDFVKAWMVEWKQQNHWRRGLKLENRA
ncbi:putative extracellular serine carboxypeptidase [Lachnellula occidentalis]|uniref:Putative extracellular serine carboxypeptidase n=1 Tax=Lachnellula occidentalis TaxID=215460 RepID=A0A8H8S101_9HELO|nr:putative extracellular serine carboxypeptidase [Lachnellula occidentalis]